MQKSAQIKHSAAVREKQKALRDIYGGMMTTTDLTKELGYSSRSSARAWLRETSIPGVRMGNQIRYATDLVAKTIVDRRGMA